MGDWNLFFATAAGSAATLVGLLFIATQLHLGVFADPKNRWVALGQSTLTILATAFVMSLAFLIPSLGWARCEGNRERYSTSAMRCSPFSQSPSAAGRQRRAGRASEPF